MLHVDHLVGLIAEPSSSSAVLQQAVYLARKFGAAVHTMPVGEGPTPDELRRALEACVGAPGAIETDVVSSAKAPGRSMSAIRQVVEEMDADLVLADTPADRGPIPPLADSSVGALVRELNRPVYIVGQVAAPEAVRRILVPTDLSDPSRDALKHAVGLASIYGGSVELLHVIDTSPYVALTPTDRLSLRGTSLPEHRARRRLQAFVETGRETGISVHAHIKFGDPADQVAHFVDQEAIDLVVLSSHGTRARPKSPLGRVADRILRRVAAPTFLLRASGRSLLAEEA